MPLALAKAKCHQIVAVVAGQGSEASWLTLDGSAEMGSSGFLAMNSCWISAKSCLHAKSMIDNNLW